MRKEYVPSAEYIVLLRDTGRKRMAVPGLQEAMLGGLAYLYDSQVRDAKNYSASYYNFLPSAGFSRKPWPRLVSGLRSFTGNHMIREKHLNGSWPGYIHLVADPGKIHAHPFLVATDYNLFTTVSTAYPLLLFDDRAHGEKEGIIGEMLENARQAIVGFKNGDAYNFWRLKHYREIDLDCPAPMNVPVSIIDFRVEIYKWTKKFGMKDFRESGTLSNWFYDCYDKTLNPTGSSALFNIPNDADNTSMAIAFQMLFNRWLGNDPRITDTSPLDKLPSFRDLERLKSDRNGDIIGKNTGAFLTWLKDEKLSVFSFPETGVIPLGINNVDIVANSNVLLALSLAQKTDLPGYREAIRLFARLIENYSWHDASFYYPQRYIFPYSLSRAWRDAGIREPLLDRAMAELLAQVLGEVDSAPGIRECSEGSFPVNHFNNFYQSTALGLITLLNAGRKSAEKEGLAEKYDRVIQRAVSFLVSGRISTGFRSPEAKKHFISVKANYWESGVLYSSSIQQLAHWRSHAQTTALVLEALAKYSLAYDLSDDKQLHGKLSLNKNGGKWSLSPLSPW